MGCADHCPGGNLCSWTYSVLFGSEWDAVMNETMLRGLKRHEEYAELWSTLDRCNWIDITGHGKRIYPGWNRWMDRQLLQEFFSVFRAYK